MAIIAPEEAYTIADLEDSIQDKRKKHYGVRDGIPNMRRFLDAAIDQNMFDPNDIYNGEFSHSSCGVFCHR